MQNKDETSPSAGAKPRMYDHCKHCNNAFGQIACRGSDHGKPCLHCGPNQSFLEAQ